MSNKLKTKGKHKLNKALKRVEKVIYMEFRKASELSKKRKSKAMNSVKASSK